VHNRVELTRYAIRRNGEFTERTSAVEAETWQRGTQPCPGAHYQQTQVARFTGPGALGRRHPAASERPGVLAELGSARPAERGKAENEARWASRSERWVRTVAPSRRL